MQLEVKRFDLDTKSVSEDGHFEGFAAVYGNVDLGGDVIVPGAFAKTVSERNKRAPVFHEHSVAVGAAVLEDTAYGLKAIGELNLDKQSGRDAYSDLKFFRDRGIQTGMSMKYKSVQPPEFKDGIRYLRELRLYEVTLTLIPMNEKAAVSSVKSSSLEEQIEAWEEIQAEIKSGRKISKERALRLRAAAKEILSLLAEAGVEDTTTSDGAEGKSIEPVVDHSALSSLIDNVKGELTWSR